MQIILKKEVPSLGREGDILKVAQGYANNYLIPNGFAVAATSGNLKQLDERRSGIKKRQEAHLAEAEEQKAKIHEKSLTMIVKAGAEGRLYGSISTKDMAEAIEKDLGLAVDRRRIEPSDSIKEVGEVTIKLKLYPGVEASVLVKVMPEVSDEEEVSEALVNEEVKDEDASAVSAKEEVTEESKDEDLEVKEK